MHHTATPPSVKMRLSAVIIITASIPIGSVRARNTPSGTDCSPMTALPLRMLLMANALPIAAPAGHDCHQQFRRVSQPALVRTLVVWAADCLGGSMRAAAAKPQARPYAATSHDAWSARVDATLISSCFATTR